MQAIRSFLYLDDYRMYSISSQIFEGITEYLIDFHGTTEEESEQQRGPIGSGRVMADILKSESTTQERKYLHDYSYNLFEGHLSELGKVLTVSEQTLDENLDKIDSFDFIKVKGKAIFNDMNIIKSTIADFNKIGRALAYVGSLEEINALQRHLEKLTESTRDRNEKTRLRQRIKQLNNIDNLAKEKGLYQDPKFLEYLEFLLNYGFQDQFELQVPVGRSTFSANLNRDYLREREDILVRRYSRFSEKEFVLFGMIAQGSASSPVNERGRKEEEFVGESETPQMKEVIMQIVASLSEVETSLSGKLENEIVIDPIAIYREVQL